MSQSASSPYPVRPIDENELDGFLRVDEHAFNTSPWSDDDRRVALDLFEFDRTGKFVQERVSARKGGEFRMVSPEELNYIL